VDKNIELTENLTKYDFHWSFVSNTVIIFASGFHFKHYKINITIPTTLFDGTQENITIKKIQKLKIN
jgi:hypothetical protein